MYKDHGPFIQLKSWHNKAQILCKRLEPKGTEAKCAYHPHPSYVNTLPFNPSRAHPRQGIDMGQGRATWI